MPVIEDAWAHALNRAEHLSKVHAIIGKNHLHTELASKGGLDGCKPQQTATTECQVLVHTFTQAYRMTHHWTLKGNLYSELHVTTFPPAYISMRSPPPKAS